MLFLNIFKGAVVNLSFQSFTVFYTSWFLSLPTSNGWRDDVDDNAADNE